ncbi:hypothetical protein B0H19DRAFT_1252977 [Mycena capillaripes]|nr:hypothetical protein B0H19DRAFT_1252977 [Mycena capillaripes]
MASTSKQQLDSLPPVGAPRKALPNVIWQWTLTPEAIAPCFARDVFEMDESGIRDAEFFWLGRIPCRTVKLVGLVVGVQEYETRVVYSLDDGTGVIECVHRPPAPNMPKQEKLKEPQPLLKPVAWVGWHVVVIGRVSSWHETRRILVDSIVRCPSSNDEPNHWIAVGALHRTYYFLEEPFVLPLRPPPASQMPASSIPIPVPATPSSASSAPSSPSKSSPVKSPHKLRHPSKLHTRDLTDNAFRIYLKHYMDYADDIHPAASSPPSTPTKSSRIALPSSDETPRPYPHSHSHDHTPRRIAPLDFTRPRTPEAPTTRGFTLSYLRRVPELALMAKRVVKAEAKRRAREAAKKAKAAAEGGISKGKPAIVTRAMINDTQKLHPRMKRLFTWAILQLVKEGAVISWDGPARPCQTHDANNSHADPDSGALWRLNSSTASSVAGNSTVFSSASIAEDDEDEGELTDPELGEEAFVSLTPAFLANTVEGAIATLVARATARARASSTDPNRARMRAQAPGPTVREVVSFLKGDDTWRNLSEFAVKEALELLKDEGRAWTMGGDRWELSL